MPTSRLRRSVLDAAKRLLSTRGPAISIAEVAEQSGVLESAVQDEFADSIALLHAVLLSEIEDLIADLAHRELADGLVRAALAVSDSVLLEGFAGEWSGVLAQLARVDVRLPGWAMAAQAIDAALARVGRCGTPTVLRWLASYFCAPASAEDIRADVDVLISGLPPLRSHTSWSGQRTG